MKKNESEGQKVSPEVMAARLELKNSLKGYQREIENKREMRRMKRPRDWNL